MGDGGKDLFYFIDKPLDFSLRILQQLEDRKDIVYAGPCIAIFQPT
jgi:hypothetical protein